MALVQAIAKSPLSPRLVEVVEPGAAKIIGSEKLPAGLWSVIVAAAGNERVVERHGTELARMARETRAGSFEALTDEEKRALLGRVREFVRHVLEAHPAATIFRITALPTAMAGLVVPLREIALRSQLASCAVVRAGGMVYFAVWPEAGSEGDSLRRACEEIFAAAEGAAARAVIELCPAELKREVNVWGAARDDFELMQRMKKVFDPGEIFAPGRFVGGI